MSYTPDIIIDFKDLVEFDISSDILKDWKNYDVNDDKEYAYHILQHKFNQGKDFSFKGNDFIIIKSELSYQVKAIRKLLDNYLGIEYCLID